MKRISIRKMAMAIVLAIILCAMCGTLVACNDEPTVEEHPNYANAEVIKIIPAPAHGSGTRCDFVIVCYIQENEYKQMYWSHDLIKIDETASYPVFLRTGGTTYLTLSKQQLINLMP
jgi:hypothetical protein